MAMDHVQECLAPFTCVTCTSRRRPNQPDISALVQAIQKNTLQRQQAAYEILLAHQLLAQNLHYPDRILVAAPT